MFISVRAAARHASASARHSAAATLSGSTASTCGLPAWSDSCSNSRRGHKVASRNRHGAPSLCWYTVSRTWPTPDISSRRAIADGRPHQQASAPLNRHSAGATTPGQKAADAITQQHKPACAKRKPREGRTMTDTAIDMTAAPQTMHKKTGDTAWKRRPEGRAIQAPANAGAEFSLTLVGQGETRIGSNFFRSCRRLNCRWCHRSRTSFSLRNRSSCRAPYWQQSPGRTPGPG